LELSLGKGWPVLRPLLVDLGGSSLLHAGIAVEECRLEQITTEVSDGTKELTEIGAAQWLLFVEQASWHLNTASALMRMLRAAAGLAAAVAAINGESVPASRGSSGSALEARIFDEISGNEETRKLLADAAIADGECEAGMSLLLKLTENGSPGAAIGSLVSMLRYFVSSDDHESVSATLPTLLARTKTVEPGGDSWLRALVAGAESAAWLGDTNTAAKLAETLVYGPGPATGEHAASVRLPASFQLLTALVELGEFDEATRHLEFVGSGFGLSAVCWMLEPVIGRIPAHVRSMIGEVVRKATRDGIYDVFRKQFAASRVRLLDAIELDPSWEDTARLLQASADEPVQTSQNSPSLPGAPSGDGSAADVV
jgi:hypothetical protein